MKFCCELMRKAASSINEIPINMEVLENGRPYFYIERFTPVDVATEIVDEEGFAAVQFCPFCGSNVSVFPDNESYTWKRRNTLCNGFLLCGIARRQEQVEMFEYNHINNKFYMHARRGYGDKYIHIKYCVYCGEPLSDMVAKYGIPSKMSSCIHTDEWWKKRGL